MRAHVTTALEIIGFGFVTAAAHTVSLGLCLLVGGVSCVVVGVSEGRK